MTPSRRKRLAAVLLGLSIVLGALNVAAFLTGAMSHATMDLVTNALSWLAITMTLLDVYLTTDVRVEQDNRG